MPRKYKLGLKPRPGDKAGEECEGPGCHRTTSSTWLAAGRSCTSDGCKKFFKVGPYRPPKVTLAELDENLAQVANFCASLPGQKRSASAVLPIVPCVPLPVEPFAAPEAEHAEAQEAIADAERSEERATAAEACAADLRAQMKLVLRKCSDRLIAESQRSHQPKGDFGGHTIPASRMERETGLSLAELGPFHRAMDLAFMPAREGGHFERVEDWWDEADVTGQY